MQIIQQHNILQLSDLMQQTFWNVFYLFSQKIGFEISCKLSPRETICMTCQSLFSGKNKKMLSTELTHIVVKLKQMCW